MRLGPIALVLCALLALAAGDVAHLRAKARLLGRLGSKHHKRGALSAVPTFKLGHDIPHVTHSVVKPLVVNYPPTAAVTAVKVPLAHPLIHRYPVPVGHRVPVPHPHYGLKFPHHTKSFVLPKPNQHFHHHHHHVPPRPVVPVVPAAPLPATPIVPVAQPSVPVAHPVPVPSPPVFLQPAPIAPAPLAPPPVHILPPHHGHLSPLLPAATAPLLPAPAFPVAPQFQYIIRPGNAIQTSLFATYPRYPLVNYQQLYPLSAAAAPTVGQVFLNRPQVPHFHVSGPGFVQQPSPAVAVEPTPTLLHPTQTIPQPALHLQPTQPVPVEHDGWAPVPSQPHDLVPTHTEAHFHQPHESHFTQQQGTQVFEHHTGEQQYHDYQNQLQHHVQHQIDQAQYEQHLNNQHQLSQEYGAPQQVSQEYGPPNQHGQEYSQHDQEYAQQGQEYSQHGQEFAQHGQGYTQHGQEHAQHDQEYAQQEYAQQGQEYAQQGQEYALHQQQLGQEYGLPEQQVEGRSSGTEDTQRYHNHIPLGLQPPINRPLEHFR